MTMTPEEAYAVEQTLAEGAPLTPGLKAKQIVLNGEREAFKTWVDEHKNVTETKADGSWAGNYTFTREEFHKRNDALKASSDEFHISCEPVVAEHRIEQVRQLANIKAGAAARMARNGGANAWGFGASEGAEPVAAKSLYDSMGESPEFKALIDSIPSTPTLGMGRRMTLRGLDMASIMAPAATKDVFSTAAGFPIPLNRTPLVVPFAHRRPVVPDFIPTMNVDQQAFPYLQQTTWTNNAAVVAEAATKPESALAYTQTIAYLEVIATTLPITKQVQWFAPQVLQEAMRNDLVNMLKLAEEDQILNGSGTRPQLQGITTRSGVQTYAKVTGENNMDAIFRGQQQVRFVGYAEPDVTFINPANTTSIVLSKDTQGRYLFGDPHSPAPLSLWGLPLVQTTGATSGTAITGDFGQYALLLRHGDVMVTMGYVGSQFAQNLLTMLVEELVGLAVTRPAAFATITALV